MAKTEIEGMERWLVVGTATISVAAFGTAWAKTLPSGSVLGLVVSACVVMILVATYFVPTYIARRRGHHNATAILALNILLGWTFLGWVVAVVWALMKPAPTSV